MPVNQSMAKSATDFFQVQTRAELAAFLGVPLGAVNVVSLVEKECRTPECPLLAALSNHGRCVLCQQTWFPRELDKNDHTSAEAISKTL